MDHPENPSIIAVKEEPQPETPAAVGNELSTETAATTTMEPTVSVEAAAASNTDGPKLEELQDEKDEEEDGEIIEDEPNLPEEPAKSSSDEPSNALKEDEDVASSAELSNTLAEEIKDEPASTNAVAATSIEANDEKEETASSDAPVKEETKDEEVVASMDVESMESNELDPKTATPESPKALAEISNNNNNNNTTTYSTRGRSTEAATTTVEEKPIHIRDAFEESPRPKDPASIVSFLSETMTEEERRTRTRFLPEVDGMHVLRKSEIKDDIALARSLPSIVSPSGVLQTRAGRLASAGRNSDAMDLDGEEASLDIHDEDTAIIELPSSSLPVPSDAFVAPKGVVVGESEFSIAVKEFESTVPSPSKVESVTSFNPPRPPESVGGKKKHRMIRWERRPEDIEVDMKNYRRTVQRTRQELQKSETEYERIEMIDAHLRRHFLNHSELIDHEYERLNEEMEVEVEKLTKESELIGSRTRSRNLSKVDVVMRDVLTMLTRNEQKDDSMDGPTKAEPAPSTVLPGFGGLNAEAFSDWERSTELKSTEPCISWIEPGQKVKTSYGEGTVIEVIPPESPPSNDSLATPVNDTTKKTDEEKSNDTRDKKKYESLLPLRVKVQLGYGTAVLAASAIEKMESPAHFTDAQLAKRWKGMIDSALKVGACIDLQGMLPESENGTTKTGQNANGMDTDAKSSSSSSSKVDDGRDEWLPFGATLIPTKSGRGNFLDKMELRDIEDSLQSALYDGHGVLGRKSNPGVTEDIRKWEDDEQEYLNLRASILQLKNKLYRQRRITVLNKRTTASMNERYLKAEDLVSEMRSDLKSLKRRLGDELKELGITEAMANQILFRFYQGHQEEDKGDASTPRRLRRTSSMIGEMLPGIEMGIDGREVDSMDDQGTDDLSGDDLESQRPAKRIRSGE